MGLLDLFKRKKNNNTQTRENSQQNSNVDKVGELLKQATQLKKDGNINEAVNVLRIANEEMNNSKTEYLVTQYLRLPQYLQQAGFNDEAWGEFNKLKLKFTSDLDQSLIEDKMRLFLQREKKFDEAIWMGILSYMHRARHDSFLIKELKSENHFQTKEKVEELKEKYSINGIKKMLTPLLKKANKTDNLEELAFVLEKHLKKIPNINFTQIKSDIKNIVYK